MGQKEIPLFFAPRCRAEQVGRYRRRGTRPPESAHTTAKVAPIVKGEANMGCMLHGAPPTTPALSQAPSRHDASPAPLPLALGASGSATATRTAEETADPGRRPSRGRMAGSASWQGGNTGMEETACTLWEKAWGEWARAPILLHPPLKGLELLFRFCHRRKGKEGEEPLPHHPHRHTDTRSPIPHSPRLHCPLDNITFKDKQPLPSPTTTLPASPPSGSGTQEQWVPPLLPTDTLQPPGKRE